MIRQTALKTFAFLRPALKTSHPSKSGWMSNGRCKIWSKDIDPKESFIWSGQVTNKIADGFGTLICIERSTEKPTGEVFVGAMRNGKAHGQGMFIRPNGDRYDGQFVDSEYHGPGTLITTCGVRYEGEFASGIFHGHGILTDHSRNRYEGAFANGEISGWGVYQWANGARYEGLFLRGQEEGWGTLSFPSGNFFSGQFKNGKYHGHGTLHYAYPKRLCEGEWRSGRLVGTGQGIFRGQRTKCRLCGLFRKSIKFTPP